MSLDAWSARHRIVALAACSLAAWQMPADDGDEGCLRIFDGSLRLLPAAETEELDEADELLQTPAREPLDPRIDTGAPRAHRHVLERRRPDSLVTGSIRRAAAELLLPSTAEFMHFNARLGVGLALPLITSREDERLAACCADARGGAS
jgi:hypothetical protein